ncbi:SH3 domain-containing protein [Macromonas nakdongensis]|uniref:SH3 domain-containing protein n=1 Tax=Macromonas nakdongensis TaxID=1843082 RepID=UPI000C33901C|nr:SH3 domain-containing protein [Macromonas nakdongensis]
MRTMAHARTLITAAALGLAALAPSWAQELVSVRNPSVNLRAGPGTDTEVLWKLTQGYPLQVLEKRGDWLRVQDFEGDGGWIARSVTSDARHHVVKATRLNLRAGPGTEHPVVGQAVYGDVLRTAVRQGDWVQLQAPQGGGTVWAASDLLWGW